MASALSSPSRLERTFTQDDQLRFAELSGDWNPVHVDPVAARRTPYGQIVHGVHAVAWWGTCFGAWGGSLVPRLDKDRGSGS